ncbi:transposase, partial [Thermus thalpophilus]
MEADREHPLYYLDAETLLVATYCWVDDALKALQAQGVKLPKRQKHQKATLAELLTLALFILLQGQDLAKGYLAAKVTLRAYFPSLPHISRFYRVLKNAHSLLAHLAQTLAGGEGLLQVVDLKPIPLAHGHRVHRFSLPESAVGVGPLGAFAGHVLVAVMNEKGLFFRFGLLPGNARETWGEALLFGLPAVLGDRGFRWVQG